jgi:hypothetical protein
MPIESSTPIDETGDAEDDQPPRRPLRAFYLKALGAAVVLAILVTPDLMRLSELVGTVGRSWFEELYHVSSIALTLATLVIAPIAIIRVRSQDREASRSYGGSAALAAAVGLGFTALHCLGMVVGGLFRGWFPFAQNRSFFVDAALRSAVEYSVVSIVAAWLTLASTGVGRRASGGFEWLCLGLGLLWILAYVGRWVLEIAPWLL